MAEKAKNEENDEKKTTKRFNPDYEGLDTKEVEYYEEKIEKLKKKGLVPEHYTIFTPIQLLPER